QLSRVQGHGRSGRTREPRRGVDGAYAARAHRKDQQTQGQGVGASLRPAIATAKDMASRDPAQPAKKVAADAAHASVQLTVERWAKGQQSRAQDEVAEEFPVALVYHAVPHVVMLATPADLEDYAVGFTLSEGLVGRPEEIRSVEVEAGPHAVDVRISIAWERFSALLQQRRNLTGRTGCGLCGAETVEQAIRTPAPLTGGVRVSAADLHKALEQLASMQPLNARTGSVHAAAWV